jgi:hypothetical protein
MKIEEAITLFGYHQSDPETPGFKNHSGLPGEDQRGGGDPLDGYSAWSVKG